MKKYFFIESNRIKIANRPERVNNIKKLNPKIIFILYPVCRMSIHIFYSNMKYKIIDDLLRHKSK